MNTTTHQEEREVKRYPTSTTQTIYWNRRTVVATSTMVITVCLRAAYYILSLFVLTACYHSSTTTTTTTTCTAFTTVGVISKTITVAVGNSNRSMPFLVVNKGRRQRINNDDFTYSSPALLLSQYSTVNTRLSTTADSDSDNGFSNNDQNLMALGIVAISTVVGTVVGKVAGIKLGIKAFVLSDIFFLIAALCRKAVVGSGKRKPAAAVTGTTTAVGRPVTMRGEVTESISASILKKELLSLIPKRPFDGPATNITTSPQICSQIENVVGNLELLTPLPPLAKSNAALQALNGDWQLRYSDASEITRISKLPLGFRLGPVYQPIDVANGRFENQALIKHKFRLCSGHTRVVADFFLAELGNTNRVGVINKGERANVCFLKILFTLRRFLMFPTFGFIRKTAISNGPAEQANVFPSIDVTYLDDTMRIARGGDGSLFVLTRPSSSDVGDSSYYKYKAKYKPMPMLSKEKADTIVVDPKSPTYDASIDILPSGKTKTSSNSSPPPPRE